MGLFFAKSKTIGIVPPLIPINLLPTKPSFDSAQEPDLKNHRLLRKIGSGLD